MTVLFTKQFWSDTSNLLTAYAREETAEHKFDKSDVHVDAAPLAERIMWGEHYHLKEVMPLTWQKRITLFDYKFVYADNADHVRLRLNKGAAVYFPPYVVSGLPDVGVMVNDHLPVEQEYANEVAILKARYQDFAKRVEISKKWDSVYHRLRLVFAGYRSLSGACAAHPELKVLIPNEYLSKLTIPKRVPSRVGSQEYVNELVAAAVEAKLRRMNKS
jgi:hypothetical protein